MALPDWDGKSTLRQLTAEVERQREIIDRLTGERALVTGDLQRIAHELGIGAKPYSGHEAMERDILPEIHRLKQIEAVYESIVTRKIPKSYLGDPVEGASS